MAKKTLTVHAIVKDGASASLKKVKDGFDNTSKSVKNTSINMTEFNRIMFSTSAFVGFFTKQLSILGDSLTKAGELERLTNQFERTLGPKGDLFKQISSMTSNTIDRMEAMRAGVALQSTGIIKDTRQLAEIVARAGTAAKRAGLNSAEGIQKVVDFMKNGTVSSLSFLNVLTPTNSALQTQMAVLQKAGGIYGTVLSTQAKLRMGMAALRAVTSGMENDERDLSDTLQDVAQSFSFLRGESSLFLGKALTPLFDKFTQITDAVTSFVERLKTNDKTMMQTVKNIVIVTGAFTTLLATLGTGRLLFKALGALGIGGVPFLAFSLLGLTAAFSDAEKSLEPFIKGLKIMGAVFMGTFQLMSSFLGDSENFSKGIGKIDKELANFLRKEGFFELTKNVARTGAVIVSFVKDTGNQLIKWLRDIGDLLSPIGKMFSKFFGDSDPGGWSRSWIESSGGVRDSLVKITAAALGVFGGLKLLGAGKGLLGNLPVVGKMFGRGVGRGPEGTARDPLYVTLAKGMAGLLGMGSAAATTTTTAATGLMGGVGTAIAGIAVASAAGFALGKALEYSAKSLGEWDTAVSKMDSIINMVADALGLEGSDAKTRRQLALQATEEYKMVTKAMKDLRGSVSVEQAQTLTRLMQETVNKLQQQYPDMSEASLRARALQEVTSSPVMSDPGRVTLEAAKRIPDYKKRSEFLSPRIGSSGQVTVPSMPKSYEQQKEMVVEYMSGLEQASKAKIRSAFQQAIAGTSAGGKAITPDEWVNIFTSAMNNAEITKDTKKQASKPTPTSPAKTRGC